jgi:thioredoxin reductase (NADPH)
VYDVIIIGAGPAGVSASLYTQRAGKNTLIIYSGNSSLEKTEKIENYYGFENGISGEDLYNNGINQAKNIGVDVKNEDVIKIEQSTENTFNVFTSNNKYEAKAIIMAVGQKRKELDVKGATELEGKGVSYCAICDGFFFRNKDVVVIGSGDYAVSETNDLINLANKITILTNGEKAPDIRADNVEIITKGIKEIAGENKVEGVVFKDDSSIKADGVFIAQGGNGPTALAKKLGLVLNNNRIDVDENMHTNIQGIFACGDCTEGLLQVCKAVYDGAKAGLEAVSYLNN